MKPNNQTKRLLLALLVGNIVSIVIIICTITAHLRYEIGVTEAFKQQLLEHINNSPYSMKRALQYWVINNTRQGFDFTVTDNIGKTIMSSSRFAFDLLPPNAIEQKAIALHYQNQVLVRLNDESILYLDFDIPPPPLIKLPWEMTLKEVQTVGNFVLLLSFVSCNIFIVLTHWMSIRFVRKKAEEVTQNITKIMQEEGGSPLTHTGIKEVDTLIDTFNMLISQAQEKIAELQTSRTDLTAKVTEISHDFKTPLTSINQVAQNTKTYFEQLSQQDIQRNMRVVLAEVSYISRMVENMLFLTEMNSEPEEQIYQTLCLSDLLEQELESYHWSDKTITSAIQADIYINGCDLYVGRLIKNLLDNAYKYSDNKIHVALRRSGTQCIINVENNGQEITNKQEFGYRKSNRKINSLNGIYISMGLGSVIIRKIVTLLKGELHISDYKSGGTVIEISIPKSNDAQA